MIINHRSIDLLVVMGVAIVDIVLVLAVPQNIVPIRILTLPLVCVLPGYALASALFARRVLGVPEHLVFSLGLSSAIMILGGLALNSTPFGLRANSWSVLLGCVTLCACLIALARRQGQRVSTSEWLKFARGDLTLRYAVLLCLAVAVICGAVIVSIIGAERQPFPRFTQLWILPAGGAEKNAVHIGVNNLESSVMEYSLDVNVDGTVVKVWPAITLRPNEKWEVTLLLSQTSNAGIVKVEAMLYRRDAPTTVFRHVMLDLGT